MQQAALSEDRPDNASPGTAGPPATNPAAGGLERIFQEHNRLVFRAAVRITGSASDAEDVLQTVFMRLVRRGDGGAHLTDNPGAYLRRAAVNAALDVIRSRTATKATGLDEVEAHLADDTSRGPDSAHEDTEVVRIIREAVANLSPKAAEIFALRYFEDYADSEIARMLGTTRSTVAVTLHRARNRLREDIRPLLEEGP